MIPRTPFIENMIARCQQKPGRVIFPEGDDPRIVSAAQILIDLKVAEKITLLTTTSSVEPLDLGPIARRLSTKDPSFRKFTEDSHPGTVGKINKPTDIYAVDNAANNPLYLAGALLDSGEADCVIAGCVATTANVIRAAISSVGLAPGIRTVSGSFMMDRGPNASIGQNHETYLYADCGVVIDPTPQQLSDIALASCETLTKLTGKPPVVAFLSFSSKGSAQHPAAQKMIDATRLFSSRAPHIDADGELQFDAALVEEIGKRKAPDSKVPGRANCFVFPDLDAGNIAYKITQRLGGFAAYGPILQGLAKPYSDLSRGATAEDIAVSALINILRAR